MQVIDFANGQPPSTELPDELILRAAQDALSGADVQPGKRQRLDSAGHISSKPLEYGDHTVRFRNALSKFLGRCDASRAGSSPDPCCLFPTAGVSQALDLLCTLCASAVTKDVVLTEAPTYFLSSAIFQDHGLEVRGVATDEHGILPDALQRELEALRAEGRRAALLYIIPIHHNPTGRTMPEFRRLQIVAIAKEHGVLIAADEVYTMLTYDTEAPPRTMASLGSHVLSVASFSKILAPGLRVGWIEGAPEHLQHLGKWAVIDSGGYVSHFASCVVASALELELIDTHMNQLKSRLSARLHVLLNTLRQHLPGSCVVQTHPKGGYFIWLKLPPGISASAVASEVKDKVRFKEGAAFSPDARTSADFDGFIRLCFARLSEAELSEGARSLCEALHRLAVSAEPRVCQT